jgi:hypothetical protein
MEQTAIFSQRIRWLAIVTGIASGVALFPILFLFYPILMIGGGIMQPRYPTAGKWLVWAGAGNLWIVLIEYDATMFPHPWRLSAPEFMVLLFAAATALLAWCSVELIADALTRMRLRSTLPRTGTLPVSRGLWVLLAALNLMVGWAAVGLALPSRVYSGSANFYSTLATSLGQIATVMALDVSLARRVVKLRRARRPGLGTIE